MTIARTAEPQVAGGKQSEKDKYKVLIVDDSAVIRGLVTRWLKIEPSISVVASASNGLRALKAIGEHEVDVVILDIEMPEMDGMTALPKLLREEPSLKIIMSSTLTEDGAAVTLRALSLGAADYIPKPSTTVGLQGSDEFRKTLVAKVKALGAARHSRSGRPPAQKDIAAAPRAALFGGKTVALRRVPLAFKPQIVAVGASTGGPHALRGFFRGLKKPLRVPVVVTQHMPAMFTPPENYCRPAVDVMLRSVVAAYQSRVLSVILTGMGHDGRKGGEAVVESGGVVIAAR